MHTGICTHAFVYSFVFLLLFFFILDMFFLFARQSMTDKLYMYSLQFMVYSLEIVYIV